MVRHTLSVSDHFGTFCIKDSTTDLITQPNLVTQPKEVHSTDILMKMQKMYSAEKNFIHLINS